MARKRDVPSRGEVSERIDKSRDDMREQEEHLETTADDVETIRGTLEELELGGTAEGSDEVEASIEHADDVTVDVFDDHAGELDEVQGESQEHESELQERADVTESDLGKISDASARIETDEAVGELVKAKEGAVKDVEFLAESGDRAREAGEESERIQQELESRVHGKSGG